MLSLKINNLNIFILTILYLILKLILINLNNVIFTNIINPFLSLCFLIIILAYKKNYFINQNKKHVLFLLVIMFNFVLIYFSLGYSFGYVKNPLSQKLIPIIKNSFITITPLISLEIIRYILIKSNKHNYGFLVVLTILLMLLEINYYYLFSLSSVRLFHYLCSTILPIVLKNILFTYLTYKYNYYLPLTIILIDKLIFIFFPLLPKTNWFIEGTFNVIKYFFIYLLFHYRKEYNNFYKTIYFLVYIIVIIFICFMLGFFKYEAIAIVSNSMNPVFQRGDLVIYEKRNVNLNVNDIIIFKNDRRLIVHRIVNQELKSYITKGDNNNIIDKDKVYTEDIKGVYKFHIKYLGYPAIWLYELLSKET